MSAEEILSVHDLDAFYGDSQALFGVNLKVRKGQVVAIIGANGAGKSTLFKAICGLLPVRKDGVVFGGRPIGGVPAHKVAHAGVAMVPEGRRLFGSLSVRENLEMGSYSRRQGGWDIERVFELFPVLKERANQAPMTLSGGQQQMVAIGRALMSNPDLLILDEVSLGLAPLVIREVYEVLPKLVQTGITVLLVEQDVMLARSKSQHLYCLQEGRVTLDGPSEDVTRERISQAYFGSHTTPVPNA